MTTSVTPPETGSSGYSSERLQQRAEPGSVIARLGGDEFIVVPPAPLSVTAAEQLGHELWGCYANASRWTGNC